ncbi:MAG: carbamoyltransferase HypF, partial [Desulfosudaceae bacterium]
IREPWRMGISYLLDAWGEEFDNLDLAFLKKIAAPKLRVIRKMISQGLNSPLTSSLGRLFDGVAAILGCGPRVSFEGQAAMALEMMADANPDFYDESGLYGDDLITGDVREFSTRPIISGIVADLKTGVSPAEISTRFHLSLVRMYARRCDLIRSETGLNRVALSGGVFQNALFLKGLLANLEKKGFQVFTPSLVPANDGGISLGQALVAAAEAKK